MPRYGNEANFSCFLTFQTLKCSILQNVYAKPCGFIRGIHVLLLNVPEKFHYLSPKHLNVTNSSSVPIFSTFQKIGYFWIQIKVAWKQLAIESIFSWTFSNISRKHGTYFYPPVVLQTDVTALQTQRGLGIFSQKMAPSDSFVQRFLWKNRKNGIFEALFQ